MFVHVVQYCGLGWHQWMWCFDYSSSQNCKTKQVNFWLQLAEWNPRFVGGFLKRTHGVDVSDVSFDLFTFFSSVIIIRHHFKKAKEETGIAQGCDAEAYNDSCFPPLCFCIENLANGNQNPRGLHSWNKRRVSLSLYKTLLLETFFCLYFLKSAHMLCI